MIVKALGILDIFVGICFGLFGFFGIIPYNFILFLGLMLLVKGILFSIDINIVSILDIISALIILVSYFGMPKIIVIFVAFFLIQKGLISLMSKL
jgi:hypothetical protein